MGTWCAKAKCFVSDLGRRLRSTSGDSRAGSYLIQRISLAIQRGIAASVMGTLPSSASMASNEQGSGNEGSLSPDSARTPESASAVKVPGIRQVHPPRPHVRPAYDAPRKARASPPHTLPLTSPSQDSNRRDIPREEHSIPQNSPGDLYPRTPNICVGEDGKIEFVKTPIDGTRNSVGDRVLSTLAVSPEAEKFDADKEILDMRIRQLEYQLEEEKRKTQKERLAVAKLQNKLAKREGQAQRDVERECRARGDSETRARLADAEAARALAKLHAAHQEIARMEETVRTLLQYKARAELLKQEKSSLSAALEARSAHYQSTLSRLAAENQRLRTRLQLEHSQVASDPHLAQPQAVIAQSTPASTYERCLDDVAHHLVRTLLNQKGLRDEAGSMRGRIRELESQNAALSALLVRQLRPRPRPSPATPVSPPRTPSLRPRESDYFCDDSDTIASSFDVGSSPSALPTPPCVEPRECQGGRRARSHHDLRRARTPPPAIPTLRSLDRLPCHATATDTTPSLSADDKRRHRILTELWTELKSFEVTPQKLIEALSAVDPSLWAPPERPITLNLIKMPTTPVSVSRCSHRKNKAIEVHEPAEEVAAAEEVLEGEGEEAGEGVESPESGNKDEGYSTMSSDVQADSVRQAEHAHLEDLKEASDETDNQTIVSITNKETRILLIEDPSDPNNIVYFPYNLAFGVNTRNSYPPSKHILPFQHVMRSFSDSHLCLKLTTSTTPCGESCFSISSPVSSSPSMLIFDLKPIISQDKNVNPLRRTKATTSLLRSANVINHTADNSNRNSLVSNIDEQVEGSQYDSEYVQHWLKLDDTRSALQQQHRDLLELEYDRAELEDWSLSLSCEDLQDCNNWKRHSPYSEITTPGQISLSTLPSIQENNALELEEDVSECLWNNSSYMVNRGTDKESGVQHDNENEDELKDLHKNWPYIGQNNSGLPSPGGSWSSVNDSEECLDNECFYANDTTAEAIDAAGSKRSSAALSGCSDEADSLAVGTDFTRDFYRLVKYESTKSLASNSSRGIPVGCAGENVSSHLRKHDVQSVSNQDREHALQNVLNFIAEQQKYCHNREELDSIPSRPTSEIRELPPPYLDIPTEITEEIASTDRANYRFSFGSDVFLSESDSCDIIVDKRSSSRFSDLSPDLKKLPRIIDDDNEDIYMKHYLGFGKSENNEIDIGQHNLLKVHRNNEINRNIDAASRGVVVESMACEGGVCLTIASHPDPYVEESPVTVLNSRKDNSIGNIRRSPCEEVSAEGEVGCRRSGAGFSLVPVPEEEESPGEAAASTMSASNTTTASNSTTTPETVVAGVIGAAAFERKSRIPRALGTSGLTRSRIPVSTAIAPLSPARRLPHSRRLIVSPGAVSFHEAATSKDVIDELNRMLRHEGEPLSDAGCSRVLEGCAGRVGAADVDGSCWAPSGWVHVEREIDFSDPKARANLLDVMLASSDSSASRSGSHSASSSCGSSCNESSCTDEDYSRLHRLHRYRRQKTACALRSRGMAVLRLSQWRRPSIIGRDHLFVRYGEREREAVASFDFLDEVCGEGGSSGARGAISRDESEGGGGVNADSAAQPAESCHNLDRSISEPGFLSGTP